MSGTVEKSEYLVIYEKTATGYSAYVPDLPGCITTGATLGGDQAQPAGSDSRTPGRHAGVWRSDSCADHRS